MNILAVGAHHDDIDLGVGGTLAKLAKEGNKVYGIVLTDSETHYDLRNVHRTSNQAIKDAARASKIIGYKLIKVPSELVGKVGELQYSAGYMRFLEGIIQKNNIEMIFTHWKHDMNTDHVATSEISIVAARRVNRVLMYRSNWYPVDKTFNTIVYSDITKTMSIKIKALRAFPGEIKRFGEDWIESFVSANRTWGYTIGTKYAEVFEPVRFTL